MLTNLLTNGIKMYHSTYFTPNLGRALNEAGRLRAKIMVSPVVAFNGRHIAFLFWPEHDVGGVN